MPDATEREHAHHKAAVDRERLEEWWTAQDAADELWFPGIIHWFFPGQDWCDVYVTGDDMLGDPGDDRSRVDCPECLAWIHA